MLYSGTILGTRGAGKSRTAQGLLEYELDEGHRCGFIDPGGDAAGIKLNPDGTPSRFQNVIIFGGEHADIPISDTDGAKVGRLVAAQNISFICDISSFESDAARQRFMSGFADALFNNIKIPILLFVDEAHVFAPQNPREANSTLLSRMSELNTRGRKKGIFLWLLTQRVARINKNVISGAEVLIAMRMNMKLDIEVVSDWLDLHDAEHADQVRKGLAGLANGEAFISVPLMQTFKRAQFPMPTTKDMGGTPEHGQTVGGVVLPKADLGDLASLFGSIPEGDPRDHQIKQLQDALSSTSARVLDAERGRDKAIRQRDAVAETLHAIQDRIGMAIGSPQIMAADPDWHPDDILMVTGHDGIIRPVTRDSIALTKIQQGRRRLHDAMGPLVITAQGKRK